MVGDDIAVLVNYKASAGAFRAKRTLILVTKEALEHIGRIFGRLIVAIVRIVGIVRMAQETFRRFGQVIRFDVDNRWLYFFGQLRKFI